MSIESYCDRYTRLENNQCALLQAVTTGRAATILGMLFFIPAACAYAYLAKENTANLALETSLAMFSLILMGCSFGAAGEVAGAIKDSSFATTHRSDLCTSGCQLSETAGAFSLFICVGGIIGVLCDMYELGAPIPETVAEMINSRNEILLNTKQTWK